MLTSAGCSKRQISVPDVDLNLYTQHVEDELNFAPWVMSAPVIARGVGRSGRVQSGPSASIVPSQLDPKDHCRY